MHKMFGSGHMASKTSKIIVSGSIGGVLFVLSATLLQLPHHYSWHVVHSYLMAVSQMILGWFIIPLSLLAPNCYGNCHTNAFFVILVTTFGFVVGTLAYVLWMKHRAFHVLLIVMLLLNISLGLFFAVLGGNLVQYAAEICRVEISESESARIIGYSDTRDFTHFNDFFVLVSSDGGQTWQQVMAQEYDAWDNYPPPPTCGEMETYFDS